MASRIYLFKLFQLFVGDWNPNEVLTLLHIAVIVTSIEITNCQEFTGSPKINYNLIWISKILRTNMVWLRFTWYNWNANNPTYSAVTYTFYLLKIVFILQSACLFKIYGSNLPTENIRKNHIGSLLLKKIEGK